MCVCVGGGGGRLNPLKEFSTLAGLLTAAKYSRGFGGAVSLPVGPGQSPGEDAGGEVLRSFEDPVFYSD